MICPLLFTGLSEIRPLDRDMTLVPFGEMCPGAEMSIVHKIHVKDERLGYNWVEWSVLFNPITHTGSGSIAIRTTIRLYGIDKWVS